MGVWKDQDGRVWKNIFERDHHEKKGGNIPWVDIESGFVVDHWVPVKLFRQ